MGKKDVKFLINPNISDGDTDELYSSGTDVTVQVWLGT